MICARAAPPTRMSRGLRAYQGIRAHNQGLTREQATLLSGRESPSYVPTDACASSSRVPDCPKRRPPHPKQPFFTVFRRGGLRFGHLALQTGPSAGELCLARVRHAVRALLMAQTPIPPGRQVPQHPTVRLRHQRTVPEYDSEGQQPGMMPMGSGRA